jgi:hypothetical protein
VSGHFATGRWNAAFKEEAVEVLDVRVGRANLVPKISARHQSLL